MRKTTQWKQVATGTPRGIGFLGMIAGGVIGSFLAKRVAASRSGPMFERREYWDGRDEPRLYAEHGTYETTGDELSGINAEPSGGVGDKLQSVKQSVMDKAGDAKASVMDKAGSALDSIRGTASNVRERIPSAGDVRMRATNWYDQHIDQQPLIFALGAVAFGMVASALIPVSSRERQLMEPAKRKVMQTVSQVGDQLQQKVDALGVNADHQSNFEPPGISTGPVTTADSGSAPGVFPPLDDLTTRH